MSQKQTSLGKLLSPSSIAIIGATDKVHQLNGRFQYNLKQHGFTGRIYLVNPRYERIGEEPCYPDVLSIPPEESIDAAIITVGAAQVPEILAQCARRGIKGAVIFSSGFAEAGPQGELLQQRIVEIARENDMAICGPNCMGLINVADKVVAYGTLALPEAFRPGPMAIVSQTGAMAGLVFNRDHQLPFTYLVSVGNEAVTQIPDYVEYFLEDERVRAIGCYIEGLRNPKKFVEVADRAVASGKPLVVLKIGRSEAGQKAAMAHTGSLTGSDAAYDALFRSRGIIRVSDIEDLFLVTHFLSLTRLPQGNRIGVVSISGGAIGLICDRSEEFGFTLPEPSPEIKARLAELLGIPLEKARNPIDVNGRIPARPELVRQSLEIMMEDPNFDAFIVIPVPLTQKAATLVAEDLVQVHQKAEKPFVVLWSAGPLAYEAFAVLEQAGVPLFRDFERGLRGVQALHKYAEFRRHLAGERKAERIGPEVSGEKVSELLRGDGQVLGEAQSKKLLRLYGVPVVEEIACASLAEAKEAAAALGYPVAVKIDSPDITHKTEAGGVKLGINTATELEEAFTEVIANAKKYKPGANVRGVVVQQMIPAGVEVIVGVKVEPSLGPFVLFGSGGVLTELVKDVILWPAPFGPGEARHIIQQTRVYRLLEGFRGRPRADIEALVDCLVRISWLAADLESRIGEMDINPLIVRPDGLGVVAVDALVVKR